MNIIKKNWKLLLFLSLIIIFCYAILQTIENNALIQKKQAQEAKNIPITSVQVMDITSKKVKRDLTLVGTLKPYQILEWLSDTDGKITEIFFDTHQYVKEGEILARTDAQIKQTNSNLSSINYKKAKRDFERFEVLFKNNNLSEFDLENARLQMQVAEQNLKLNQQIIDYTTLKSPMSGYITQKMVSKGKFLQVGSPIATITDISRLRLIVNIAPQDLPKIIIGQKIPIQIPSLDIHNIEGIIKNISVQSNESGSFPVEIWIVNHQKLLAGLEAEATITQENERESIFIPRTALLGEKVFVLENNKVIERYVSVGKEYDGEVEIITGLKIGEKLIIKGQQNIENGQKVKIQKN